EEQISNLEGQDGVTLSGGDPFFQVEASLEIARYCKSIGLNVWAYTGFKYEELISNNKTKELLKNIDVLVDGKFEKDKKSLVLRFRGSSNQRIIDVNKSLELGKIVVKEDKLEETYCKPEGLFI
ncbi:MAG: radical SAM protein, partial [Lachnospiraceae bacterium]|nr:radical SAM protein [Lachnospiraceae bacterium]